MKRSIMWFQKISIPPPQREKEIPKGWGSKAMGDGDGDGARGGWHSLIWSIQGHATRQGMVFGLSALNWVYNFIRTCPKLGMFCLLNSFKKLCLKNRF